MSYFQNTDQNHFLQDKSESLAMLRFGSNYQTIGTNAVACFWCRAPDTVVVPQKIVWSIFKFSLRLINGVF